MKQGSADNPFEEDYEDELDEEEKDQRPDSEDLDTGIESTESRSSDSFGEPPSTTQRQSLPYIHSRNGVKDGRIQRPIFLREHIEDGIDDLVDQMEDEFGEDVYKTDVTEAAMAVAQEHPELVRQELESWGYGWD